MGDHMADLRRLKPAIDRLCDLADKARGYRSGDEIEGVRLLRVRRSSGKFSDAVVTGLGHAGLSAVMKLRHEKGGKVVSVSDLVEWNPWLNEESGCG